MASVMVWVTCRVCGEDFECVEGMYAHRHRLCPLCDRTPAELAAGAAGRAPIASTVTCRKRQRED